MKTENKIFLLVLIVILNAYSIYPLGSKIKAGHFKDKIDSLAAAIDENSRLMYVGCDSLELDGTAETWFYTYASLEGSEPVYYWFYAKKDSVVFYKTSFEIIFSMALFSSDWIDSDSAMVLAEEKGGKDFRTAYPDSRFMAYLSEPLIPNSYPTWFIQYVSNKNPENYIIIEVDAVKKDTITDVPHSKTNLAEGYTLYQNYPNPFNPETVISYAIGTSTIGKSQILNLCHTTLKVYDMLGREVAKLVDEEKPAGSYSVSFNANSLPSGIYLYSIRTDNFTDTKKMVLIR